MKRSFCYLIFVITFSICIGHNFHCHFIHKHNLENNLSSIANHHFEEHAVNHDIFIDNFVNTFIFNENMSYLVDINLIFQPQLSNSIVWQPPKIF